VSSEPSVAAVARSGAHGFAKEVQETIAQHGIKGDAHTGGSVQHLYDKARHPTRPNLRQVLLVEEELILELTALGFCLSADALGENITTRRFDLTALKAGAILLGPPPVSRSQAFVALASKSSA
jgi:MOSC domain-containing protein YiiM